MAGRNSLTAGGRLVRGVIGLGVVVVAGQVASVTGVVSTDFLPPPSEVITRAVRLAGDADFRTGLRATLAAWAVGLLGAIGIGVPLGLLLGGVPVLNTAVRAVLEALRPIPSVALIPLVSLILGAGIRTEATLVCYAATWPVLYNTMYGVQDADPVARQTLRVFGFSRFEVLLRVSLPAAAPFIATGVRLAAAVALILAVGTEILAGFGTGLGIFIAQAEQVPNGTTDVLAGAVWAGALGLAINAALVRGERRLFHWHAAHSREAR
jgi:NitT/TauT family transport system permease protein